MSRLLLAEWTRLRSRRITLIGLLAIVLLLGVFQLQVNDAVTPPSAADAASSRAEYEHARRDWQDHHQQSEQDCVDAGQPPAECKIDPPTEADFGLVPASFRQVAAVSLQTAMFLTALVAFLICASFIGAEYTSGAIANWLSFVPRRNVVFASKLIVVAAFGVVLAAAAGCAVLLAAAVLVLLHGGTVGGVGSLIGAVGRGAATALILAVVGFCLALLGRHTSTALGVLLGYLLLIFVRMSVLLEVAWAQRLTRWSPEGNLLAIVNKSFTYSVPVRVVTPEGVQLGDSTQTIGFGAGIAYWAVLLAGLVALTWFVFRRRDVT